MAFAWVHYDLLTEAYGNGPPHYGRTTNRDKWSSPVPALLVIDAIGIAVIYILIRFALRRRG